MCQLLGISTETPVRMRFSWDRFVLRGSAAGGNPDGWGVAYADASDVQILREPMPAADSPLVRFLGQHGPASTTVVSHIRRATKGDRCLANTHPFARVLGGRTHVFAHNGYVAGVEQRGDVWLRPVGTTDSERLFGELLARLAPLWARSAAPALGHRTEIVAVFAEQMRQRGAANFLYFDGLTLFAHAHRHTIPGDGVSNDPGLYLLVRDDADDNADSDPAGYVPCDGVEGEGPCGKRAVVATLPLDDQPWRPLASGELVRLQSGIVV